MKTLVVCNQKGGTGKTTASLHIAMDAYYQGLNVLYLDFDLQKTSSEFLKLRFKNKKSDKNKIRGENELFKNFELLDLIKDSKYNFSFFEKLKQPDDGENLFCLGESTSALVSVVESDAGTWVNNFSKLDGMNVFDICIIDTGPTADIKQILPLVVCDFAVSPVELSVFSMRGVGNMIETIINIKEQLNPKIQFLGLLPSRYNASDETQKRLLLDLRQNYERYMYPHGMIIPSRKAFSDSAEKSLMVWEIKDHVAPKVSRKVRPIFENIVNRTMSLTAS